ncbi:UDP:flavonoid glycosyltransferase YjiC, YdhE family [Nocardiopsis flavescens]|uniref:UDP:flavonoid glycosyltransferase YjiC, YdhE family n=1 Tax=Nocardiopsis flavescens TaxID=758803 RepID=A0A1M6LQC8_9ACTN|nr:nucleotide disphospho-sugar-binding domain-containing protein [Nocardiopsis flavescens]SHJ73370.1 UDP:flavonoid glycosyltransferase YjiC, YdhE family [Nocardiopsis flavescens]
MRVLITTHADSVGFSSMVPLAWALRNAGHEVRVATQPALTEEVVMSGLTAVPVGEDHRFPKLEEWSSEHEDEDDPLLDLLTSRPEDVEWELFSEVYTDSVNWWWKVVNDPWVAELVGFCRWWGPDLVLWEPVSFAGGVAAEVVGAVHGRVLWGMDLLGRMRSRFVDALAARGGGRDPLAEWLGDRAGRAGGVFSERMVRGHFTVDPLPEVLGLGAVAGVERVPVRYVPYNGPAVVPEWVPGGGVRVCVSLGTSVVERLGGYSSGVGGVLEGVAAAAGGGGVVAALPGYGGAVPAGVRSVSFVPLHVVVPGCGVLVDHGGPGTLLTGMAHAVPQVLLPHPHMFDAPLLAARYEATGAGLAVPADRVSAGSVREAVERVLSEGSFAGGAAWLRDRMEEMPSPAAFAAGVEDLVDRHRSAGAPQPA